MPKKTNLSIKIFLFLILTDVLETFTQFCFKKTAIPETGIEIKAFSAVIIFAKAVVLSPFLWIGLISVLFTFIIWSTILSKIDLSVAVPLASFSYIMVPLASIIFLHEKVPPLRWLGICFILAGVVFVSISSKQKKAEA